MKIISIDVGIKNLAYCLLESCDDKTFNILQWDVLNLCGEEPKCQCDTKKKGICNAKAKYSKGSNYYCKSHAKKTEYLIPSAETSNIKLKKKKINELVDFANLYEIKYEQPAKKDKLRETIVNHLNDRLLNNVTSQSANAIDLIQLGIVLRDRLDKELHMDDIDQVIIENQISPIANRMKSLQGMIAQYFIMRGKEKISFISASNKLKPFIGNRKTTYTERKKLGVDISTGLLVDSSCNSDWIHIINTHKKNDDLADSFLQGIWYLNNNNHIVIKYKHE
tara:strand:+ start:2016 stop:2852 length:837 start_codon:yes stop_codon:yes gene_type:complete